MLAGMQAGQADDGRHVEPQVAGLAGGGKMPAQELPVWAGTCRRDTDRGGAAAAASKDRFELPGSCGTAACRAGLPVRPPCTNSLPGAARGWRAGGGLGGSRS